MKKNMTGSEIKMELKGRDRKEREGGAGFLASLLSKLGLGAGGNAGSGVAIGASRMGAGALWSGMLASKTGIVALVLAGTTVAAGIGVIGTQTGFLHMPGSADQPENLNVFRPGPKQVAADSNQNAAAPAANPGVSQSLQDLNAANKGQLPDQSGASNAGTPSGGGAPDNSNGAPNTTQASYTKPKMVASASFQNSSTSGGSTAHLSPTGLAAGINGDFASVYHPGASNRMATGSGVSAAGSSSRLAVGRRMNGALGQAQAANGVVRGNLASGYVSSRGSGLTYDGGGKTGLIGPNAGGINGGGAGVGGAGISSQQGPAAIPPNSSSSVPPPVGNGKNDTPWQWASDAATYALMIAIFALGAMALFKKMAKKPGVDSAAWMAAAKAAAVIAAIAGATVAIMGLTIMTTYGQTLPGMMWAGIGSIITYYATSSALDMFAADDAESQIGDVGTAAKNQGYQLLQGTRIGDLGQTQYLVQDANGQIAWADFADGGFQKFDFTPTFQGQASSLLGPNDSIMNNSFQYNPADQTYHFDMSSDGGSTSYPMQYDPAGGVRPYDPSAAVSTPATASTPAAAVPPTVPDASVAANTTTTPAAPPPNPVNGPNNSAGGGTNGDVG